MATRGVSVSEALQLRSELKHLEFKGPGPITSTPLLLKVVRAMLAMANNQDGGTVVIGIDSSGHPQGCTAADAQTWTADALGDQISRYADPYITFEIEAIELDSKTFVRIFVNEFDHIPVICKRDGSYSEGKKHFQVLQQGFLYVRSRRKPESVPVPGQTEMREILDLAIEKGLRKAYRLIEVAGRQQSSQSESDETKFQQQLGEL